VAPDGGHKSHAGAALDPAETDDGEAEVPAPVPVVVEPAVPVVVEPAVPVEEIPLPPEPPVLAAPVLVAAVEEPVPPAVVVAVAEFVAAVAEFVAGNVGVREGKLTPPCWLVRAVPAACGAVAVCAAAGIDARTSSGNTMRAVVSCITALK
jgi:hypothetical protein